MSEENTQLEVYRARAIGTNVNAVSLLATDYLNHFNEALMLAEMLVDMPDMLEDFASWEPKHYKDHFRESGIADRELAVEAYDVSPVEYRDPFDNTVLKLNKQLILLKKALSDDQDALNSGAKNEFVSAKCNLIRSLIDRAGGIINGQISAPAAEPKVDDKAAEKVAEASNIVEVSEGEVIDQSDIDALFD
jgi:hypothetical protein